ncbi:MAG: type II toxin-antitoxin system VapC family toxin [Candidatus Omnitrophica bacterium]|nr:type II toxin-antitoxin system VapC family toxin [Candidatus Omnitrophota bacterium]
MKYLLDTHTWVWWHTQPDRISEKVMEVLTDGDQIEELLLSAISIWEFCKLLEKGRLGIKGDAEEWLSMALRLPGLRMVPLTPRISYKSTTLPPPIHGDPADQIIVATAREESATLLTSDRILLRYEHVLTLW